MGNMENLISIAVMRVRHYHYSRYTLTGTGFILLLVGLALILVVKKTKLLEKIEDEKLRKILLSAAVGIAFLLLIIARIFFSTLALQADIVLSMRSPAA